MSDYRVSVAQARMIRANRTTAELNKRVISLIKHQGAVFKTITADNGTEFHGYKEIEAATGVRFYFAHPHHSWELGTNENTNGLIRQYLPKGKTMAYVSQWDCTWIAEELNTRPQKTSVQNASGVLL